MAAIEIPLTASTFIYTIVNDTFPAVITFKSSTVGRKIEISTDNGIEYFIPAYDFISANMLVVALLAPVTHIKVTGSIADKFIMVL